MAKDDKAFIWFRPYVPPPEVPDKEYPFWLDTGRVLEHWHTGTMTRRVPQLQRAMPAAYVEISREDAAALGVKTGDKVRLETRRGSLELPAWIDGRGQCPKGHVFVPVLRRDEAHQPADARRALPVQQAAGLQEVRGARREGVRMSPGGVRCTRLLLHRIITTRPNDLVPARLRRFVPLLAAIGISLAVVGLCRGHPRAGAIAPTAAARRRSTSARSPPRRHLLRTADGEAAAECQLAAIARAAAVRPAGDLRRRSFGPRR